MEDKNYSNKIEEFKKDTANCVEKLNTLVEIITGAIEQGKTTIYHIVEESKALARGVIKVFNDLKSWFKSLFHVSKKVDSVDTAKIAEINEIIGA